MDFEINTCERVSHRKLQMDTGKHELKPSVFICVYPGFIEDIWNRCTSMRKTVLFPSVILIVFASVFSIFAVSDNFGS